MERRRQVDCRRGNKNRMKKNKYYKIKLCHESLRGSLRLLQSSSSASKDDRVKSDTTVTMFLIQKHLLIRSAL